MIDEMRKASIQQATVRQKEKADKMIWVTFKKEGIHKYPAALECRVAEPAVVICPLLL